METNKKDVKVSRFMRFFVCCTCSEKFSAQQTKKQQDFVKDRGKCETFIDMDLRQKSGFLYHFWRFQNYLRRKVRIERKIKIQKKPTSLEDATQSSNNVPCSSSLSLSPLPDLVWAMSSRQVVESHREDWKNCLSGNSRGRSWYRNYPPGRLKLVWIDHTV